MPYFKVSDMNTYGNEKYLTYTSLYINKTLKVKTYPAFSIIIQKNGGAVLTNKKRILLKDSVIDLNTGGFTPAKGFYLDFAYLYFLKLDFKNLIKCSVLPTLDMIKFKKIIVALPPLQEQFRIVKKIEEIFSILDALKDHQTSLLSKLDLIKKVAIDKAIKGQLVEQRDDEKLSDEILTLPNIEGPFEIPKNWKWITLANIGYGNVSQIKNENIKSGTWILELEDIGKHTGKILRKNYLKDGKTKSTKNIFKKGDVLYSKLRPYLNKVVIADEDGVCSSEIIPINLSKSNFEFLAQFLQLVLMSPYFVSYASSVSYGVKMPRLGTKDGKQALIPYPPLQEQNRIVQKLEEILSTVSTIENLLKSDKT